MYSLKSSIDYMIDKCDTHIKTTLYSYLKKLIKDMKNNFACHKILLTLFCIGVICMQNSYAQRGRSQNGNMLSDVELRQRKYDDSMQRVRDSFSQNFNIRQYFEEQKRIQLANDKIQLDETIYYLRSLEGIADTMQELVIQSSILTTFPESIRDFKKLKSLTLRRCKSIDLRDLVDKISSLTNLEELNIVFSEKTTLPENIGVLKNIKRLNLNGNKLSKLPEGISELKKLEEINLHNNTPILPEPLFETLSKIKTLKKVRLSGSRMSDLTEKLALMDQIVSLDLRNNDIIYLPSNLSNMASLKEIDLSNNRGLRIDPALAQLSAAPALSSLILKGCKLTELPATIGILKSLKKLDITNNPIQKIHTNIDELSLLEELYLGGEEVMNSGTLLNTLPSNLSKCTNLKVLYATYLGLEQIPSSFSTLTNLETLNLSWNNIKTFPEFLSRMDKLKYLNLNRNSISIIPNQLGRLGTSLEELLLDGNFYGKYEFKIKTIPQSITTLKNLKKLSLKDQVFEALPESFWSSFSKMEELNLSGALLQEIPNGITGMISLKKLSLKGNEIKILNPALAEMTNLSHLDVSSNLDFDPEASIETIKKLTFLKQLDISYNNIKRQEGKEIKSALKGVEVIKREMSDSPEAEKSKKNFQNDNE